jgi:LacI family transcriptional regulator
MTPHRITLQDIARQLDCHYSTVSRALRHDRRIPTSTRKRVLRVARQLGYRPDPMLSAIAVYRTLRTQKSYRATLGWMTNYPTRNGWRGYEQTAYFETAQSRAAELGYTIEEFWLREPHMTLQRTAKILMTRNIKGLFFTAQASPGVRLRGDWSAFSAVTFGRSLASPLFHNIDNDHFRSFSLLMQKLNRLGYRRPGFALWPSVHEKTNRAWASAFLAHQPESQHQPIPLFLDQNWTRSAFKGWFFEHRPDVVITHDETLLTWLESWGLRVPADVAFALAAKHAETSARCSGIDENSEPVARAAVNILVDMINRGETGPPAAPVSTLVQGRWIEGNTVRHVRLSMPRHRKINKACKGSF